jgi:hypothetical protein
MILHGSEISRVSVINIRYYERVEPPMTFER